MGNLLKLSSSVFNQNGDNTTRYSNDLFSAYTFLGTAALNPIVNAIALLINPVVNTVSGDSGITIPAEVKSISITGKGGDSVVTNPGQAYVAPIGNVSYPSGLPAYVAPIAQVGLPEYPNGLPVYKAAVYGDNSWYDPGSPAVYESIYTITNTYNGQRWTDNAGGTISSATESGLWTESYTSTSPVANSGPSAFGNSGVGYAYATLTRTTVCTGPTSVLKTAAVPPSSGGGVYLISAKIGDASYPSGLPVYIASVSQSGLPEFPDGLPAYNAGQPYIAPTYSVGEDTTVVVEGTTYTWLGGVDGAAAISSTRVIAIVSKLSQTVVYNVATGSSIIYTYTPTSSGLGGGMIWLKDLGNANNHLVFDTVRGLNKSLSFNNTAAQVTQTNTVTAYNENGFTLGTSSLVNALNNKYEALTFAQATKFHVIVEYIGNGATNRLIEHNLGITPGMLSIKAHSAVGNWITRHMSATGEMYLEQTAAQAASFTQITAASNKDFTVNGLANTAGVSYIAYLFADDISEFGLIRCGSYVAGNQTITNTLTGSGTISIPAGVTSISLTGKGGSVLLTDNSQPYIAPTGNPSYPNGLPVYKAAVYGDNSWYDPGQPYIAPVYSYSWVSEGGVTAGGGDGGVDYNNYYVPTAAGQFYSARDYTYYPGTNPPATEYWTMTTVGYRSVQNTVTAGQPYIAPSSGGGIYLISAQVGLPEYPSGLPVYNAGQPYIAATMSPEFPEGLPVYVAGQQYIAPVGNVNYPSGLPVYKAAVYGDNSWYDPGQPYIAPSGYHEATAGQAYIAPFEIHSLSRTDSYVRVHIPVGGEKTAPVPPNIDPNSWPVGSWWADSWLDPNDLTREMITEYRVIYAGTDPGQPYIAPTAAYYDNPGQPYIAPSSGGGAYLISAQVGLPEYPNGLPAYVAGQPYIATQGDSRYPSGLVPYTTTINVDTTVTINNFTTTWEGTIYGTETLSSTENLVIADKTQDLIYNVGQNGSLSYTYNVVGSSKIDLKWEPQFVLIKKLTSAGNWVLLDTTRGLPVNANGGVLSLNTNAAETKATYITITGSGFTINSTHSDVGTLNSKYAFMAIRLPNKVPDTGSQIYNAVTRTGTNATGSITSANFLPDVVISKNTAGGNTEVTDRIRGSGFVLTTNTTEVDTVSAATSDITNFTMKGIDVGTKSVMNINASAIKNIIYFLKRAPKVFDIVGYNQAQVFHNLKAVPELIISKSRSSTDPWNIYHKSLGLGYNLLLNSSAAKIDNTFYNGQPTEDYFKINIGAPSTVVLANVTSGGSLYTSKPTVTITGGGGSGATAVSVLDSNYNPGQEYIAPSGYVPARQAVAEVSHYEWRSNASVFHTDGTSLFAAKVVGSYTIGTGPYAMIGVDGRSYLPKAGSYGTEYTASEYDSSTGKYVYWTKYSWAVKVVDTAAVTYRAAYYTNPGQAYIAPSGGHVTGITITNGGNSYSSTPTLTITGGGGSGATGTAVTAQGNFYDYISLLFGTLAGVSKVFDYVGNDTTQTIDCGFSNGSKFIIIKNADGTGDFFIWDSTRGIIDGNDPHLSLNNTTAEVILDDSIDPTPSGFIVNQNTTTNINVLDVKYVGFSIG